MKAHLKYLIYVLKHKWHVFWQCWRFRYISKELIVRGLCHDITKFKPSCWGPYVDKFMRGDPSQVSDIVQTQFRKAFEDHWSSEDHHWEHWCHHPVKLRPYTLEEVEPKDMSDVAILEMICDWRAMSTRNGGHRLLDYSVEKWYRSMEPKMRLSHYTKIRINAFFEGIRQGYYL